MSKSKRAKESRNAERLKSLELQAAKKQEVRRQNWLGILAVLCGIALIAIVCFSVSLYNNGAVMRKRISMESANYQVNNCMLSYYVYEQYRAFVNENYDELSTTYKLDNQKSLKKQNCTLDDGSWYDYFLSGAQENLRSILLYAEAAHDAGMKLDQSDNKAIDARIKELEDDAAMQNYTSNEYYKYLYGRGVHEQDLRDCFTLEALAEKYKQAYVDDAFTCTDAQLNNEFTEDLRNNAAIDYLYLTITPKYQENANEEEKQVAKKTATEWAEKFKTCTGIADFQKTAQTYTAERYDIDATNMPLIEMLNLSVYETIEAANYTDTEFGNAAFDEKVTEGTVIITGTADTQYTVYCITKPMYKPSYPTKNVGVIPFSTAYYYSSENALRYAQEAQSDFTENPTAEHFAQLAKESCNDYKTIKNNGQYKNVKRHELATSIDNWIFDEERKENDCTVITAIDSYYLVWYIGNGEIAWQSEIISNLYAEFETAHLTELESKFQINVNKKQMQKLSL
ncbi:MAG: peptidylprolyl isomerase [Clostridia bacterium]|nr:peptidylprolyl isomerase [Clostridia bacterium]